MTLKISRSVKETRIDPETGKKAEMIRAIVRDEVGNIDVIRFPEGSSDEEIRKAWDERPTREAGLAGKEIE